MKIKVLFYCFKIAKTLTKSHTKFRETLYRQNYLTGLNQFKTCVERKLFNKKSILISFKLFHKIYKKNYLRDYLGRTKKILSHQFKCRTLNNNNQ